MSIERLYTPEVSSRYCAAALRDYGALLLRGFACEPEQEHLVSEVLSNELTEVDRSGHTIPEQFQDIEWVFDQAPPCVYGLGQRIKQLVCPDIPLWQPNRTRAQLYSPGEVGIEWHRDYKRDLRVIAVASFIGPALFEIILNGQRFAWELLPGDLVLMRGALLNGQRDDRPRHRILAPKKGQRLSVAYREVADKAPRLEAYDE